MSKHSPTPWKLDGLTIVRTGTRTGDQDDICYMNNEGGNESSEWFADSGVVKADAEFIVKAVNCHEELIDIIKELREGLDDNWITLPEGIEAVRRAKAAIANG
jgi:hypothetical protein